MIHGQLKHLTKSLSLASELKVGMVEEAGSSAGKISCPISCVSQHLTIIVEWLFKRLTEPSARNDVKKNWHVELFGIQSAPVVLIMNI